MWLSLITLFDILCTNFLLYLSGTSSRFTPQINDETRPRTGRRCKGHSFARGEADLDQHPQVVQPRPEDLAQVDIVGRGFWRPPLDAHMKYWSLFPTYLPPQSEFSKYIVCPLTLVGGLPTMVGVDVLPSTTSLWTAYTAYVTTVVRAFTMIRLSYEGKNPNYGGEKRCPEGEKWKQVRCHDVRGLDVAPYFTEGVGVRRGRKAY